MKARLVLATPHARNDSLEEALRKNLPSYEIVRIRERDQLIRQTLDVLSPEWIFFSHWSWLIPEAIHENYRCVIFHMTDLPYGRGGSPLQNLIVRGHKETAISALRCVGKLDAGPIYMKRPLTLEGTAEEILRRASSLMGEMIVEIVRTSPDPIPQSGEAVEFVRRKPEDGDLSKLTTSAAIYDFIRMLDGEGYPPAFLEMGRIRVEFSSASLQDGYVQAQAKIMIKSKLARDQIK